MPENDVQMETNEIVTWEIDESDRYRRGKAWYGSMVLIGGGLLIYAVASANFLFALLILMFALVIYLTSLKPPENLTVEISLDGVKVGETFYPYRDIKRYWFVYDPPEVKNLYLDFKAVAKPMLSLPLMDQNPNRIRQILSQYLPEDFEENEEPFMDFLGRILKL
ncbi:MAG: hypothetical protein V1738_01590 [Patescibacteria group bacterium]